MEQVSLSSFRRSIRFPQPWSVFIIPVLFFLMLLPWAMSSPIGSSPDEDYHASSIWCAWGYADGECLKISEGQIAVPKKVGAGQVCYAFKQEVSADCLNRNDSTIENPLTVVTRENTIQKLYPTMFYQTMHIFVGENVEKSVYLMRIFNAFLASLIMFLVLYLTPRGVAFAYLVAYTVGMVPLGLFIIPSINPSSWALIGITGFWAFATALLTLGKGICRKKIILTILTAVSAFLAIGSRTDTMIYVGVTAVIVLLYVGLRNILRWRISAALLILLSFAGLLTYLTVTPPGAGELMGKQKQTLGLFLENTLQLPLLYEGIIGGGHWGLGWHDTPMFRFIPVLGLLLLGGVTYYGIQRISLSRGLALTAAVGAAVVIPLMFLQLEGLRVGVVVQPRYLLPLFFLLILIVSVGNTVHDLRGFPLSFTILYGSVLLFGAVVAFLTNLHRYAVEGTDVVSKSWDVVWVNNLGVPFPVVLLAGIAFTGAYFVMVTMTLSATSRLSIEARTNPDTSLQV